MNPQVQQATILLAMGLQGLAGDPPVPPQAPTGAAPLVTEGVRGRRGRRREARSASGAAVCRAAGLKDGGNRRGAAGYVDLAAAAEAGVGAHGVC